MNRAKQCITAAVAGAAFIIGGCGLMAYAGQLDKLTPKDCAPAESAVCVMLGVGGFLMLILGIMSLSFAGYVARSEP